MKALLRELVTSATYPATVGSATPELSRRILGIDSLLGASAKTDGRDGSRSDPSGEWTVQPEPWAEPSRDASATPEYGNRSITETSGSTQRGRNSFRRAIYTFVKRTSGYPSFLIFDGSDRATSLARRIPTNTPLQALVTLNDPVYDEAAQALAMRVQETSAAKSQTYAARLISSSPTKLGWYCPVM